MLIFILQMEEICLILLETGSHSVVQADLELNYIDQGGLEPVLILLALPAQC